MSDITFVKGYGFPRGSAMDYAGYGGYGAAAGPRMSPIRVARYPEPGVFAPIPALDGIFEGGSDDSLTMGPITLTPTPGFVGPTGIGADGLVHYPDGSTCDPSAGSCPGGPFVGPQNGAAALWGFGLLAVGIALYMNSKG